MFISPLELAELAKKAAEDRKGWNITILDISKISTVADFFVICTGSSSTNVQAITDSIEELTQKELGLKPRIEGYKEGRWIVLDYGDVVVHVFQEEEREFYNLERLWGDASVVEETMDFSQNSLV